MENEAITEYGTGKTYQPGLCFIEERATTFPGDSTLNEAVWCVTNTGVSVCSASQRDQWGIGHTGSVCCIYCQNTTQPEHTCKETCKQSKDVINLAFETNINNITKLNSGYGLTELESPNNAKPFSLPAMALTPYNSTASSFYPQAVENIFLIYLN